MGEWEFTHGCPPLIARDTVIYMLGRLGDVYGPMPYELVDPNAWTGDCAHASHDLIAWAPYPKSWREAFPLLLGAAGEDR